jgi:diguanylate cyclase (GGDEF)-like protein
MDRGAESLRAFRMVTIAAAIVLTALLAWQLPDDSFVPLVVFTALLVIAAVLRMERDGSIVGFEAVVAFPAIVIQHDPALAAVATFVATVAHALWLGIRARRLALRPFVEAAGLTLSFFVAGFVYHAAVGPNPGPMAIATGYLLLCAVWLLAHTVFALLTDREAARTAPAARRFAQQGKVLLLISPVAAVEILAWQPYGPGGVAIAFLPVLLAAYVLKSEADTEQQNVLLTERNRQLGMLSRNSTALLGAESIADSLTLLTAQLSDVAPLEAAAVVTWESIGDPHATVYRFGRCLRDDAEIVSWVERMNFAEAAPAAARVHHADEREFSLGGGEAHQLIIGIQTMEVTYGVLVFESCDETLLRDDTLELFAISVNQTALAVQNDVLQRELRGINIQLRQEADTKSTILAVSHDLVGKLDVDAILNRISEAIISLGFGEVGIALIDPSDDSSSVRLLRRKEGIVDASRRVPSSSARQLMREEDRVSNSYFIRQGNALRSSVGLPVDPRNAVDGEWGDLDILLVPIMSAEEMIGYFAVGQPNDRKSPSLERVQTLEIFANQAGAALQSAQQFAEIARLTTVDSLTPAFNHRYFRDTLTKELHRHARNRTAFAVALVDIDDFKRINDTWGHPMGDEILKDLVAHLFRNVRESDIVARTGGDEFALILPDTAPEAAIDVAERLRQTVADSVFTRPLQEPLTRTISIGLATYPLDAGSADELVASADKALYEAKRLGKNRLVCAEPGGVTPVVLRPEGSADATDG